MSQNKQETLHPLFSPYKLEGRWRTIWWAAFAVVLIGGWLLAGIGYRHGLPFVDVGDEMTIWTYGRAQFDPAWKVIQPDYPPGIVTISRLVQQTQIALGDPFVNVAVTVEVMRVMTWITYTISLALVMIAGRRLAGPLAGITAGVFWATFPMAIGLAKQSTSNHWVVMLFIGSIAAALEGWRRKSLGWILLSLVLTLLSAAFRWQGGAALAITGLACLTFWKMDKHKMVLAMAIYWIVVAAFAYWAIVIQKALSVDIYYVGQKPEPPTLGTLGHNFLNILNLAPFWIMVALPLIGAVLSLRPVARKRLHGETGLWALIPVIAVFTLIVSFQGVQIFERQYLAIFTVFALLAGVGLSLGGEWIVELGQKGPHPQPLARRARGAIAGLITITVISLIPNMAESWKVVRDNLRPDSRNAFAEWARTTATDGGLLILDGNLAMGTQTLYGYRGRQIDTPFNSDNNVLIKPEEITAEVMAGKQIRYLVTEPDFKPESLKLPITPLFRFDWQTGYGGVEFAGPAWKAWYIGDLPPVAAQPLITWEDQIVLRGAKITPTEVCRGEKAELQLLWGAIKTPTLYYSMYMHLFDGANELSEPLNGNFPALSIERPTITWFRPSEVIVGPKLSWTVRSDLPPGRYELRLGLFEPQRDQRLRTNEGKDHYVIGAVDVRACGA